ncbi:MAG: ComEC/Rec2 family competence protein [Candidatus Coproplasma sp.]
MKKVKLVNFRLPFALALSLACGIGFTFALAYYNVGYFYVTFAVPVAAVIFIICALCIKSTRAVVSCALALAFFLLGAVYSAVNLHDYESSEVTSDVTEISGRVESVEKTRSGTVVLVLSDVSADGKRLKGRTLAYLDGDGGGYAEVGYTVSALCSVEKCDLFSYGELNYNAIDSIRYKCLMYGTLDSKYGFSLFGSVRSAIVGVLEDNLPYETAAVARAMLTGDTSAMDIQTLSSFRYGGIAHIFAVSGLHIGVIYAVLSFILNKLRLNKYLSAAIKISLIVFYAGVCGFTPSSVRAAVMCSVAALSTLTHLKYDGLNSLSIAAIILLAINPLNLFDAGFILSFSAMLGIIFLVKNIGKILRVLPKKLQGGLSVSLSAQAATFPAQMLTFGYVSWAGLVLNVFFLPILSALYAALFSATVISLIIPPAAAILPYVCMPLEGFISLFVSCGFENAVISGISGWWVAVLPAIFLAALSDKFNLSLIIRAVTCVVCALSFTLATVFDGTVYNGARITVDAYYGGCMTLVRTSQGNILVVTQGTDSGRIYSFVNKYCANRVRDLIVLGDDNAVGYCLQQEWEYDNIYLYSGLINAEAGENINYLTDFSLYGVECRFVSSDTVKISVGGVDCAILLGQSQTELNAHLIVSPQITDGFNGIAACYGERGGDYNVYLQGCLQFDADNGKITVKGLLPVMR